MTGWNSWGSVASPAEQENLLLEIRGRSPSFCDRYVRCYANFQFLTTTRYGADRVQALKQIPSELVDYEPCRLPRAKTWENQAGYAFVVSPHGNGLDCHRTWEALVLGCIPIVKSSRIDGLYEGLPVLIVDSWRSVSIELLRATIGDFKRLEFDYERLSLQYWVDRIRQTGLMCQKYL
jgi:hypothetical protein